MEKKEVTKEEIKKMVKEYIERMFKLYKTLHGVSTDSQIDCPQCGRYRGIAFIPNRGVWICHLRDCNFTFPKELIPPTPYELKEAFDRWRTEEKINKFLK